MKATGTARSVGPHELERPSSAEDYALLATAPKAPVSSTGYPTPEQVALARAKLAVVVEDNQDQDQDQAEGRDHVQTPFSYESGSPGPGCFFDDESPELYALLAAHDAGTLQPLEVELGPMPPGAGKVMQAIRDDVRLLMGLRLAVGDDRALPYSTGLAVAREVAPDKGTASRAIGRLVRAGVFDHIGNLPPRRAGLDGTKLYATPGAGCVVEAIR